MTFQPRVLGSVGGRNMIRQFSIYCCGLLVCLLVAIPTVHAQDHVEFVQELIARLLLPKHPQEVFAQAISL